MSKQVKIFEDDSSVPLSVLDSYVPRHLRLGYKPNERKIESYHEVVDYVAVGDNSSDCRVLALRRVPVSESLGKYKVQDFKLNALLDAKVPLSVVNLEMSQRRSLSEIQRIVNVCGDLDVYAENLAKSKVQFEAMFSNVSNTEKLSES